MRKREWDWVCHLMLKDQHLNGTHKKPVKEESQSITMTLNAIGCEKSLTLITRAKSRNPSCTIANYVDMDCSRLLTPNLTLQALNYDFNPGQQCMQTRSVDVYFFNYNQYL